MALIIIYSSCYYDVEEELYPNMSCDTTAVSFASDIQPIFVANCIKCHNKDLMNGNVALDSYDNVNEVVDGKRLLGVIKHKAGFPPMPQDLPQLPDCTILKIETWIEQGALNN